MRHDRHPDLVRRRAELGVLRHQPGRAACSPTRTGGPAWRTCSSSRRWWPEGCWTQNRHLVEALRDALIERHELVGREITDILEDARDARVVDLRDARARRRAELQRRGSPADDCHVESSPVLTAPDAEAAGRGCAAGVAPEAVVVRFGGARYAVPMADVAEVIPVPRVTRVPGTPTWLTGVVNWRGRVLSVVDLRPVIGDPMSPLPSSARLLVLTSDIAEAGLLVEAVTGLLSPDRPAPEPSPRRSSPPWPSSSPASWTTAARCRCSTPARCCGCA